jgi:hypothetical protein
VARRSQSPLRYVAQDRISVQLHHRPKPPPPIVSTATGTKQDDDIRLAYLTRFLYSASQATTPGSIDGDVEMARR